MAHHARTHTESDCEYAKSSVDQFMLETDLDPKSDAFILGDYHQSLVGFIDQKIVQRQTTLEFIIEVHYNLSHETVTFDNVLYMVGTLIDNAIESSRKHFPVYLTVSCVGDHLLIKQANATFNLLSDEKIAKMVQAGESTKAKYGRGYGLYNLNELVKQLGGYLNIQAYYDKEQKSDYLEFMISISAYAYPD